MRHSHPAFLFPAGKCLSALGGGDICSACCLPMIKSRREMDSRRFRLFVSCQRSPLALACLPSDTEYQCYIPRQSEGMSNFSLFVRVRCSATTMHPSENFNKISTLFLGFCWFWCTLGKRLALSFCFPTLCCTSAAATLLQNESLNTLVYIF